MIKRNNFSIVLFNLFPSKRKQNGLRKSVAFFHAEW